MKSQRDALKAEHQRVAAEVVEMDRALDLLLETPDTGDRPALIAALRMRITSRRIRLDELERLLSF